MLGPKIIQTFLCDVSHPPLMIIFLFVSIVLNSDFQPLELALPLTIRLETPSPPTLMSRLGAAVESCGFSSFIS